MDNGASSYRRFIDGDKGAFEEIVDLYREPLIFFISRYTGDFETAEDLAEDVFVELIIHPGRYGFRSSFKTYIFTIGRNKAVDHIRKRSRLSLVGEENLEETADLRTLEEHVIKGEADLQLSRALNQINEDYRTALHLVYLEDMSKEEKREYLDTVSGAALGSDAFFPFGDNIERARRSGVSYIAEPGGSVRDDNVIEACNHYGIAMCFTGMRLFHH